MSALFFELDHDWNWEIIEDCHNPTLVEISHMRWKVFDRLSCREQHELSKLKWLDRQQFIRNKALQLIQK